MKACPDVTIDQYMKILQLKIDKSKLIELAGTSEYEFSSVRLAICNWILGMCMNWEEY